MMKGGCMVLDFYPIGAPLRRNKENKSKVGKHAAVSTSYFPRKGLVLPGLRAVSSIGS